MDGKNYRLRKRVRGQGCGDVNPTENIIEKSFRCPAPAAVRVKIILIVLSALHYLDIIY